MLAVPEQVLDPSRAPDLTSCFGTNLNMVQPYERNTPVHPPQRAKRARAADTGSSGLLIPCRQTNVTEEGLYVRLGEHRVTATRPGSRNGLYGLSVHRDRGHLTELHGTGDAPRG